MNEGVLHERWVHSMIKQTMVRLGNKRPAMAQLRSYFLGPFRVTYDDRSVVGFESDKGRALLAYLLIEADHPHRREALAALLWPDHTETAARQNLRQALYNLHHTLSTAGAAHSAPHRGDDPGSHTGPL